MMDSSTVLKNHIYNLADENMQSLARPRNGLPELDDIPHCPSAGNQVASIS